MVHAARATQYVVVVSMSSCVTGVTLSADERKQFVLVYVGTIPAERIAIRERMQSVLLTVILCLTGAGICDKYLCASVLYRCVYCRQKRHVAQR